MNRASVAAVDFPPISHLLEWPDLLFGGTPLALNKIGLISVAATVATILLFGLGSRRPTLVPRGVQNAVEVLVEFIRDQIAVQVMGREGLRWLPLLVAIFTFTFFSNICSVLPGIQMPATGRMATPAFLAALVWLIYITLGIAHHGPIGYLKALVPSGVPIGILPLVAIIFWVSDIVIRPFSLAVRLFANMLAGHLLLVTFAVLSAALFTTDLGALLLPLPLLFLILLTGFEILVATLQAYIFTMLTAVYIDAAIHPHH